MQFSSIELLGSVLFGLAILHTFSVKRFQHLAHKFPQGSVGENTFHLLGEVEIVFGLWSLFLVVGIIALTGTATAAIDYIDGRNFTEPAFVFAIMVIAATRPVLKAAEALIGFVGKLLPLDKSVGFFLSAMIIGPLLGSFITEPAAMTVTALVLRDRFYSQGLSKRLMYATLGALFVGVSIGGTLTHFAAPPVLMVAGKWGWDASFMITHFGWKAALAVIMNASVIAWIFRKEIVRLSQRFDQGAAEVSKETKTKVPTWVIIVHLLFLAGIVLTAHHMAVFMMIFLVFLAVAVVTKEYQDELKLKEGLLVGAFLGGLVILGGLQAWWLQPVITSMSDLPLFLGSTALTAVTDNAALTYLGSQVEGISAASQIALVAGAVAGGGLTVIANAPNPAGFAILRDSFGEEGISPMGLFLAALGPTIVGALALYLLPNL